MEFLHWFIDPVKTQYADFEGRASREEFWMYVLVYIVLYIALGFIGMIIGVPQLMMLFSLAVLVPNIAITTRRLHDINKSGWWQLLVFVPFLGSIILIILLASKEKNEGNQYGVRTVADTEATASAETPSSPHTVPDQHDPVSQDASSGGTPVEEHKQ